MSDPPKPPADLAEALTDLPLFPLQEVVLFPGMLLPLHVFEPRYRKLVGDVLEGHRALAIPHVSDADADMRARPAFDSTACVGTIVDANQQPGGRYTIVVLGRARVRLQELAYVPPYRRAHATVLSAEDLVVPPIEMAMLHNAAAAFAGLLRGRDPSLKLRVPKEAPDSAVVDAYAHQLIIDPKNRQQVLAMTSVRERTRLVTEVLTIQRATLGGAAEGMLN